MSKPQLTRATVGAVVGAGACLVAVSLAAPVAHASPTRSTATGQHRSPAVAHVASSPGLVVHTLIRGASHGWSSPDDLTVSGADLFVAFQNGVPSTGGATGTPTQSTIVRFTRAGVITAAWQLVGKCDGLAADPSHHRLIATVNEDGNSSLYTIPTTQGADRIRRYRYDAAPLPHGGGTDNVTIRAGAIYVVASAPTAGGPALYRVELRDNVAHLASAPFYDTSQATLANPGAAGRSINLALTDPDSSTLVPVSASRFQGDFMLDAQGDQQAVFATGLDTDHQTLQVLNLSQSVDDTAFAATSTGILLADDTNTDTVLAITGPLTAGAPYTAVTPGNANNSPTNPAPNYLGRIDLHTGTVTAVPTTGDPLQPHSLLFVPGTH